MFSNRKKTCLTALAAAGLASGALAGTALAAPIDTMAPYNGPSNEFQFGAGGTCAAGTALTAGAVIKWHENKSAGTVAPEVVGDLCLQNSPNTYRIALVYYDTSAHGTELGSYYGGKTTGNNSSLQTTAVAKQGAKLSSSAVTHVHVMVQEFDSATSTWSDVSGFGSMNATN
jgi:hypothetical protein